MLQTTPFAGKIQGMERQLTDKQMRTLRFIYDYIKNNGYAPTVACGRVRCLFDRDYLREPETWEYGRSIALTSKGRLVCESFNDNRPAPTN